MIKRFSLFIVVNFLVITTLGITANLIATFMGVDFSGYSGLLIFYSILGMGGSLISLFTSKWMAKMMFRIKIIDPNTANNTEMTLLNMVHNMSRKAGLSKMPEVGYYEAPEVNAFATGPSRNNSLVAVSTGLMNRMNREQVEAVLGHEIAHVANGDMVTMTLIQGVMNTLVLFASRLLATAVASAMRGDREGGGSWFVEFGLYMFFQTVLGLLGAVVTNAFSRWREYRADAGGANLAGREQMISALRALQGTEEMIDNEHKAFASLKISGQPSTLAKLFATHPPLEERIARLQKSS
ncbi:MAG: protease HtpX [Pseudomonadota bacterium]